VAELNRLPVSLADPNLRGFCRSLMLLHSSTSERLPILDIFFQEILAPFTPIHSLLDLACGLNPLSLPWIPLVEGAEYCGYDIYSDMASFLSSFFAHVGQKGEIGVCDLTTTIPTRPMQVALLLKTLPCLEQLEKGIGVRLLDKIPAKNLIVSFPLHSLGGHSKGMLQTYSDHFNELTEEKNWKVERMVFPGELVFRVEK
jgi:16S rRNA (guanine(1405)-N(7))-methyltransferase